MHFPWMGVIFWIGMFAWFSIIVWTRFLRERERQQTLRALAASGQPLEPATLESMFPRHAWHDAQRSGASGPEATTRGLLIGGIVVMFAGVGILIAAQLIGRIEADALWGMSAGGVILGCVGLGLLTASVVHRRMLRRDQALLPDYGDETR